MVNLRKIKSIKLSEYFSYQQNKLVTYRIIPHTSVTNNSNSKMWRILHKMYEIYDKMPSRISRQGFKFTFREKDTIWFDVIFKQEKEEKRIEFYVSTTDIWAKKFREILENYMKITVEEVETKALEIPTNDSVVLQDIRLSRHDIFSLRVNASEQTTPIASLLTALDDISMDGDFARLSVCTETCDRKQWAQNSHWANEKLQKGVMPVRSRITSSKVQKALKKGIGTFANEIYDVLNDIMNAVGNTFFKSDKPFEKKKIIDKKAALIDELNSSRVSTKSSDKLNEPVWKTRIRVAALTENKLRADLIANTLSSAFSEIAGDNELLPYKIRLKRRKREVIQELNTLHLSKTTKADGDVSLLSCDEIAKVAIQMPTSTIQQRYENELAVNKKVETEIPAIFIHKPSTSHVNIDGIKISIGSNNIKVACQPMKIKAQMSSGILVGHAELKGEKIPIQIPLSNPEETYKGYVMMGGMGSGKDTAIQNLVVEGSLYHNISYVLIDQVNKEGHQGMANGIRDSLPPEKIVDIDLSDENYLPPIDLTEVIKKLGKKGADRFSNELIQFLEMEGHSTSKKILRNFGKACNGSIYQLQQLLENEDFRIARIKELRVNGQNRVANEMDKYSSSYEVNKKGEIVCTYDGQRALISKASAIIDRLGDLLDDATLYNIFAQPPKPEFTLEQWVKEGKVIIFRVPDRILSQIAVKTLVHWITLVVFMTRLLMDNKSQENGAFIIFNEPQTYLKGNPGLAELIARIAVQGRKERLGSIFACHYLDQLKEISEDLISGGVNWLLFKNDNENTFKKLETQLLPITIEEALNIPNTKTTRHAICILNFGGERKPAFMVRMLKPSYERYQPYDNSFITKRHSRLYGRHFEEIEKILETA
jgi:hypothetical protein